MLAWKQVSTAVSTCPLNALINWVICFFPEGSIHLNAGYVSSISVSANIIYKKKKRKLKQLKPQGTERYTLKKN